MTKGLLVFNCAIYFVLICLIVGQWHDRKQMEKEIEKEIEKLVVCPVCNTTYKITFN